MSVYIGIGSGVGYRRMSIRCVRPSVSVQTLTNAQKLALPSNIHVGTAVKITDLASAFTVSFTSTGDDYGQVYTPRYYTDVGSFGQIGGFSDVDYDTDSQVLDMHSDSSFAAINFIIGAAISGVPITGLQAATKFKELADTVPGLSASRVGSTVTVQVEIPEMLPLKTAASEQATWTLITGDVYQRFLGGDPSDEFNWQTYIP